jgi:mannose-6-phosphate isomerase
VSAILPARMVARPWGRQTLPPPFVAPADETIGEVWFDPPAELEDLLVKYIFTSQPLSVQVHPSDQDAQGFGDGPRGKEECWLAIAAEPGARLGLGFREMIDAPTMRAAAVDGSIEDLLEWHAVAPGDFFRIPPGTVHAIGAGIGLIEVQQNCDLTYRLYDYGRPRELHLDKATAVALGQPHDPALRCKVPAGGAVTLVEGPRFRLDRIDGSPDALTCARYRGPLLVIPVDAPVQIDDRPVAVGECALADDIARVMPAGRCLIAQSL